MKKLILTLGIAFSMLATTAYADRIIKEDQYTNTGNLVEHNLTIVTKELHNTGKISAKRLLIKANNINSEHDSALGVVCWKKLFILNGKRIHFHDSRCTS